MDLGGRRQRAVLALLLLARGEALGANRLIDLLWGEQPPASGAAALHSYVSHLRRALEPGRSARSRDTLLVREGTGYACRLPADAVDAWRFEAMVRDAGSGEAVSAASVPALSAALALWRGTPYAEWAGEPWADAEAARLGELKAVAVERLMAARLAAGEAAVLVPELDALVAEEPLREERWRLLALALYRAQRQSDALTALRRARARLLDELGVDPGPALREIEAQILAHAPALSLPAPVPAPGPSAGTPAAGVPAAGVPAAGIPAEPPAVPAQARPALRPAPPGDEIVERDAELARLRAALDDALSGQGGVALVEGPAGIGKTRLLGEARRMAAEHGAATLSARGSALEREFAFGAVRQLFDPLLLDPGRRERLLSGAAASAATVFDAAPADELRADGSFAVLHGLYWLVVNLAADAPVVLAVDDLQWCDKASLRFLAFLVRRLEGLPVALVATLRTGEEHEEQALLSEIALDPAARSVHPGPLTLPGVGDLVRRRLGADPAASFVAACHETTGGNPLLLRQLLRALEADGIRPDAAHADTVTAIGSRAVSSIVLMRLRRLPADAGEVARAVAVLGDGAALPAVASLAQLDEQRAAEAIAALAAAEILCDEHPLGFVHPLVRDAVYRGIAPGQRELAHGRAAGVLAAAGATAEQVAAHLLQAPARGEAEVVATLRTAARVARDRGAAESAITYLTRALNEPPLPAERGDVLLELGAVEALTDGVSAIEHLREAYTVGSSVGLRAQAARILAHSLVFAGRRGEVTAFAGQARAALPAELADDRQALQALERIGGFMHGLDCGIWQRGEIVIEGDGPGARMLAVVKAWELVIAAADLDECVALSRFALQDGLLQLVDPGLFWVIAAFSLGMADQDLGDFWDRALSSAHARGSLFSALSTHLWRGHAQWWQGDLREAEQSLMTANEQMLRWGAPEIGVAYGTAFLLGVLLDRGDVPGARSFLDSVSDRPRVGDGGRLLKDAETDVLLAEGRHAEALQVAEEARQLMRTVANPVWRPWRSTAARALVGLGRREEAVALVQEELAVARSWGARRLTGRTLRVLGELQGPGGEAALREAVEQLDGTTSRLELARALHALGALVPLGEALTLRQRALELAEACGAESLRSSVAEALRGHGIHVPEQRSRTVSLTRTQRRIAGMAVDGADPRQIAEALFLTPRSVERMLEGVRRELGVTSDAELRVALAM
nr:BTAD domain-containing putative transcriptional regulator [Motilibacter aurantiacus]